MLYLFLPVAAYLIGSVSSAIVVSVVLRLPDPRTDGSHNPGATNVLRLGSKNGALLTLAGDIAKGVLPVYIAQQWVVDDTLLLSLTGLCVFLGHLFPLYFGFAGGKGVATALGVFLAIDPFLGLIQIGIWLLIVLLFRYSSLAALVTAAATPLYVWLSTGESTLTGLAVTLAILLFWRHQKNIQRLIKQTESKIRLHR
jgi:glycerol-3-phosphate acyltransferase PlsY